MPEYADLIILVGFLVVATLVILGLWRLTRSIPRESSRESWQRWRGCTRKRAYETRKEARAVVARHMRQGDVVDAYQCRWCGRWHVGHPSPLHRR